MLANGVHRISLNDVDHWVRLAGARPGVPPVVMVHGGPGASAYLLEQTVGPPLSTLTPVLYYDQRGCGRSGAPGDPGGYTMDALVADLEALRVALGLERLRLAGFSFGGQVAARYAVTHPGRVEALVLVAPAILGPLRWDGRLAGLDAVAGREARARLRADPVAASIRPGGLEFSATAHLWSELDEWTLARFVRCDPTAPVPPSLPADQGRAANREFAEALLGWRPERALLDDLAELDTRTLVVVGLYDRTVGVDACRDIVDRMRRARLVVLERSGHQPVEQPREYATAIAGFLDEVARG